jgi:Tol biopolymer transport system component
MTDHFREGGVEMLCSDKCTTRRQPHGYHVAARLCLLALLLVTILILLSTACEGPTRWPTLRHPGLKRLTNDLNSYEHPVWSPDGRQIAFRRAPAVGNTFLGGQAEIYIMDSDGRNLRQLTANKFFDTWPSWSPDGSKIAFESTHGGAFTPSQIYVMNADGSNPVRLTDCPWSCGGMDWSPNGTRIVFSTSPSKGEATELYTLDVESGEITRLVHSAEDDFDPRWSPDGSKIAFTRVDLEFHLLPDHIVVVNADGSDEVVLTNWPEFDGLEILSGPTWSPDGRKIAFGARRRGSAKERLYVMNNDGTDLWLLLDIEAPVDMMQPDWSPDGRRIVFLYGLEQSSNDLYFIEVPEELR